MADLSLNSPNRSITRNAQKTMLKNSNDEISKCDLYKFKK